MILSPIQGRVILLEDNINTDVIYPGQYLPIIEPEEMAQHALEGIDPGFPQKINSGDIIVGGENFGCGSSREQAATCLKFAGITCIIAKSFSRIFYRNTINQGLPAIVQKNLADMVKNADTLQINFSACKIIHKNKNYDFAPFPDMIQEIIEAGGLIQSLKQKI